MQQAAVDRLSGNDLLHHIRLLINANLGKENVNAEAISVALGMRRSSLQRRLRETGTSLTEIRESIVAQTAKETLATTAVSITALASQLGYSETSAFDRVLQAHNPPNAVGIPQTAQPSLKMIETVSTYH